MVEVYSKLILPPFEECAYSFAVFFEWQIFLFHFTYKDIITITVYF